MVLASANKKAKQKNVGLFWAVFLSSKWETTAKVSYLGFGGSDWQLSDREAGGLGQGLSVFAPLHAHGSLETESQHSPTSQPKKNNSGVLVKSAPAGPPACCPPLSRK